MVIATRMELTYRESAMANALINGPLRGVRYLTCDYVMSIFNIRVLLLFTHCLRRLNHIIHPPRLTCGINRTRIVLMYDRVQTQCPHNLVCVAQPRTRMQPQLTSIVYTATI